MEKSDQLALFLWLFSPVFTHAVQTKFYSSVENVETV